MPADPGEALEFTGLFGGSRAFMPRKDEAYIKGL
jgi:hypothetical protein